MNNDPPQSQPAVAEHDALPPGTRFGEFEILHVVGVGGFGIVYLAQDHSLERQVALKEYMPAALASRGAGPVITVRSGSFAETYAIGLRSFVNEARLLARFDHPSLVKVYRFWEDNATAYMVMPYLQGITLRDARRAMHHAPDEAWVRGVIEPMLDALELLHREGVYHRDIAPDNILLPHEGPPILLDFGAARHVISDRTQSLTAILKPSYAPIEQYAEMTQMRQGPWTDLYALGAVMHFLLFGVPPPPATARAMQDDAEPIGQRTVPGVSQRLLETVEWALRVRPLDRPQNVAAMRAALKGLAPIPPRAVPPSMATPSGAMPLQGAARDPVTFQPTLMVDAADDPLATRIDTSLAAAPRAPVTTAKAPPPALPVAAPPPAPRAAPAPPPRPAATMPAQPQPQRPAPTPAAASAHASSAPAAAQKRGLLMAALAGAVVVAGVVLWQFVGLLGPGRPVPAAAAAASAAEPAASMAIAEPAPTTPPSVTATVAAPAALPAASEATAAAVEALARAQGLPVAGKGAPAADIGKPPLGAASVVLAAGAASAASGARGKPVPVAGASRPADGSLPLLAGEAPAPRASDARAGRPVPTAAQQREPVIAAAPVPAANTGPASAREVCGNRLFIALAVCMDRECENPRYRDQADCQRVLEMKRRREQQ